MEGESGKPRAFREAVGSWIWLVSMSKPDIANAVRAVARHSRNPTERHWKAVLKIIQYLLGSKELGITYEARDYSWSCGRITITPKRLMTGGLCR